MTSDGATATALNGVNLTFANPDVILGTLSSATSAVSGAAVLWMGGNLTLDLEPVLYSGLTLGSVAAGVTTTNAGSAGPIIGLGTTTLTDVAAPWQAVFAGGQGTVWAPCVAAATDPLCGYQSAPGGGDVVVIGAATYSDGTAFAAPVAPAVGAIVNRFINGVGQFIGGGTAVLVDNIGATLAVAGTFILPSASANVTALCCNLGWTESTFAFASALGATEDDDDGVPSAGGGTAGVGGVTTTFHTAAATVGTPGTVGTAALIALASAATPGAAGLATGLLNSDNHVQAGIWDLLSNVNYVVLAAGGLGGHPANTYGIDDTPATGVVVTGVADQTIYNAASPVGLGVTFTAVEDVSGLAGTPVSGLMTVDPVGVLTGPFVIGALEATGGAINLPLAIPVCAAAPSAQDMGANNCIPNGAAGPTDGYYTFDGKVVNQAGGVTAETQRQILQDLTAPVNTSNTAIPPSLTGGAPATFSAAVTDNVDLKDINFAFDFVGSLGTWYPFDDDAPIGDGVAFDGVRTTTASAVQTINMVRGLELVAGGVPTGVPGIASNVRAIVEDMAGNFSIATFNNFIAGTVPTPVTYGAGGKVAGIGGAGAGWTMSAPAANTDLCDGSTGAAIDICGTNASPVGAVTSLTLTATVTGVAGAFPNPFLSGSILFYFLDPVTLNNILLSPAVAANTATITDTGAIRTYTWTGTITSADLVAQNLTVATTGGVISVFAIGVDAAGDALRLTNLVLDVVLGL